MTRLLVTGGLGFIGSHFVRLMLSKHRDCKIVVLDSYTYAANPANLADLKELERLSIVRGDICNVDDVRAALGGGSTRW